MVQIVNRIYKSEFDAAFKHKSTLFDGLNDYTHILGLTRSVFRNVWHHTTEIENLFLSGLV